MQRLWAVLVIISSAAALWFSSRAVKSLWDYSRLDSGAIAHIEEWGVEAVSSSDFAIEAKYSFTTKKGTPYAGKTIFQKPYYLNEPSALSAIKDLKKQSWTVCYNSRDPSISSLQKIFPFQACIQAFLSLAVSVYFFIIRSYLVSISF